MDDAAILREIARQIREGAAQVAVDPNASDANNSALRRLAHELRTPLSAIVAAADVMTTEALGPMQNALYLGYASDIVSSGRHALAVVDRILAGDSDATQHLQLDFTQLDLNRLIDRAASVLRPLSAQNNQTITLNLAKGLPNVIADATSLRQILLNLLTNSIKYGGEGCAIVIATSWTLDGPVDLSIHDTGPGIAPEQLDRALSAKPTSQPTSKGHGLGLPLVRSLADVNGARLVIETGPGKGTTITLTFGKDRVVPV